MFRGSLIKRYAHCDNGNKYLSFYNYIIIPWKNYEMYILFTNIQDEHHKTVLIILNAQICAYF